MSPSVSLRHVALVRTDFSEERSTSENSIHSPRESSVSYC
jgi:hypothetical protein